MEGKRKRLNPETVQQIEDWIMSGEKKLPNIAKEFGLPYSTVWAMARKLKDRFAADGGASGAGPDDTVAEEPEDEYESEDDAHTDNSEDGETEEEYAQQDEAANIKALCRSIGEVFIAISNM